MCQGLHESSITTYLISLYSWTIRITTLKTSEIWYLPTVQERDSNSIPSISHLFSYIMISLKINFLTTRASHYSKKTQKFERGIRGLIDSLWIESTTILWYGSCWVPTLKLPINTRCPEKWNPKNQEPTKCSEKEIYYQLSEILLINIIIILTDVIFFHCYIMIIMTQFSFFSQLTSPFRGGHSSCRFSQMNHRTTESFV